MHLSSHFPTASCYSLQTFTARVNSYQDEGFFYPVFHLSFSPGNKASVTPLFQLSLSCNIGISCSNSTRFDGEAKYKVSINSIENRQPNKGKHDHPEERQCELNHLSVPENSDRLEQGHKSAARQGFTGPRTPGNILCFFSVKYTGSFTYVFTLGQVIAFLPW